jgi:hypothetical protein
MRDREVGWELLLRPTFFGTSVNRIALSSTRSAIVNEIFRLHESSRTKGRRSNVVQPAITRTMIVPHIVFTMLATG